MRQLLAAFFVFLSLSLWAQGPFSPAAGQEGSSAMHKDSSAFIAWATNGILVRGKQNIAVANSDTTTIGNLSSAFSSPNVSVVSLGDGGELTLTFDGFIYNGPGPDFAIFENAFSSNFLELAFVEVSSDGTHFFRFPSQSLTDTTTQIGPFDLLDPTNLYNLAGKFQANYGTPFDLEEMRNIAGLDITSISHIKIIDVVGSIANNYTRRDSEGRKINDPYPTAFPSGGFDLDAVGVVYLRGVGLQETTSVREVSIYPNPSSTVVHLPEEWLNAAYQVYSMEGKIVANSSLSSTTMEVYGFLPGVYYIYLTKGSKQTKAKLIVQ